MPSTSTTAHIAAHNQDGKVLHCIWSRSLHGSRKGQRRAARCILLVVTGAALTLPLSEVSASPARKTTAKSTKSTKNRAYRRSATRKTTRPTAKSRTVKAAPQTRYMQVGGVLARPGGHPALLQVQARAIPAATNVKVPAVVVAQAPIEAAPALPVAPVPRYAFTRCPGCNHRCACNTDDSRNACCTGSADNRCNSGAN